MFQENGRPETMEDIVPIVLQEIGFRQLVRIYRHAKILPAYYTCGQYTFRINSESDVYLAQVNSDLRTRLQKLCSRHNVIISEDENIHKEGNKFTKQFALTLHL